MCTKKLVARDLLTNNQMQTGGGGGKDEKVYLSCLLFIVHLKFNNILGSLPKPPFPIRSLELPICIILQGENTLEPTPGSEIIFECVTMC